MVIHRRAGKTVSGVNDLIRRGLQCSLPAPHFAYIAPYRSQAKAVAWDYLKRYAEPVRQATNEAELKVTLVNGARISLFGADNADAMRGLYFDDVFLDEYGDYRPSVWGNVIRPTLSDRQGGAVFSGTPKGKNQFWEISEIARKNPHEWFYMDLPASQSGLLPASELTAAKAQLSTDQYEQEYECSFEAAILGAYYGAEMRVLLLGGRITSVPYDPAVPVHTAWDIGWRDDTAIWFYQVVKGEIHIIDYYSDSGRDIAFLSGVVLGKPYKYGKHYLPHDAKAKTLAAAGKSIIEQLAASLTLEKLAIVPDLSVQDGIQAVRLALRSSWFDEGNCWAGVEALRQYQREYDEDKKAFRNTPRHDWTSHPADAFRMLAVAWSAEPDRPKADKSPHVLLVGPGNQVTMNDMWEMARHQSAPRRI